MNRLEIIRRGYIGNKQQLFSVRESRLCGGRAEGTRIMEINNGNALNVTVTPDRCMDIFQLRFYGQSMNYITCNGLSHPAYYDISGEGWSEAFPGGFICTCGLSNIGLRTDDSWDGQKEHGCISNRPAEHVNIAEIETEDDFGVELVGIMKEGMLAGTNLELTRKLRIWQSNKLEIFDTVKNLGYRAVPHMILYHCNLGYPLLSEHTKVDVPNTGVRARTAAAEIDMANLDKIVPPQDEYEERCYYYDVLPDHDGWAAIHVENSENQLKLQLRYDTSTLDQFLLWKNFVKGEYVMGIEPGNCTVDGKADAEKRGALKYLEPGESVEYKLEYTFS